MIVLVVWPIRWSILTWLFHARVFQKICSNEIKQYAPSLLEVNDDEVVIKHLYIERRMTPLNIYLTEAEQRGDMDAMEHGVREYGNAIKDLVAANIFPGDMLYKNFGVTRHGRVVFYDYDEIEYITDCKFRNIPAPRNEEDEMSAEPWYPIAKNDVFPEQFGTSPTAHREAETAKAHRG